ncbi:uncharacterized protein F13E9.13, mitochondrial-like [Gigantopelta aegis]|uniref:uncharacterized protein F13E9.13, mitochondrial-like n=1 Tax=Gigantopelta aegis TaxID=1735272 RepID=UPI001B8882EA|nr:uncharacterized protein F13E9.13, mitochondrial-like [Gigantopelta aegis]
MEKFVGIFKQKSIAVIGMVHLKALPGTPRHHCSVKEIINIASNEAKIYKDAGVDAVMIENMHDIPYLHTSQVGPEITSTMSVVCAEVRKVFYPGPVGIQMLAGANHQSMAVAKAADLQFIRAEGFVFSHVADEGLMNACAGELMRYRKHIEADDILVFTDIKKKHSAHAITQDVNIADTAKAAEFFMSDGVILTGGATGEPASTDELKSVVNSVNIPILVGSGITTANVVQYKSAHALIVGSHLKKEGKWYNDLDRERISRFMEQVKDVRANKITESTLII